MLNTVIEQEANLNTLYVDIKLKSQVLVIYCMNHLNTLYVDIKLLLQSHCRILHTFKYIIC